MQHGTSHSDASRNIARPPGQPNAPVTACLNRSGGVHLAYPHADAAHRAPLSMGRLAG